MVSLAWLREAKRKGEEVKEWATSEEMKGRGRYIKRSVKKVKKTSKRVGKKATGVSKQMSQVGNLDPGFGSGGLFEFEMPPVKKGRKKKSRRRQPAEEYDMFDIL